MHIYLSMEVTPMDYGEVLDAPVVFPPCERRSCVGILIVDDAVLENYELFNVTLERNGLDTRITLDPVDGLVEITDNDGMCTVLIAWSMYQTISSMVDTGMAWYISHVSGINAGSELTVKRLSEPHRHCSLTFL